MVRGLSPKARYGMQEVDTRSVLLCVSFECDSLSTETVKREEGRRIAECEVSYCRGMKNLAKPLVSRLCLGIGAGAGS